MFFFYEGIENTLKHMATMQWTEIVNIHIYIL